MTELFNGGMKTFLVMLQKALIYIVAGNIQDVKPERLQSGLLFRDHGTPHRDLNPRCVAREKVPSNDLHPTARLALHVN